VTDDTPADQAMNSPGTRRLRSPGRACGSRCGSRSGEGKGGGRPGAKPPPYSTDHSTEMPGTMLLAKALTVTPQVPSKDVYADEAQQYDVCDVRGKICFIQREGERPLSPAA
jgi:hypothetical protein